MVVGLEEGRVRCSGGSSLGWEVGDSVVLRRANKIVGWAQVEEIGDYQVWVSGEALEARVGDRVQVGTPLSESQEVLTKRVTFKTKIDDGGGGGGINGAGLFNLFGLYNLIDNQRYARRYGDSYYRTSSNVNLAMGVAGFLFNQFNRPGRRSSTVEAQFAITLPKEYLKLDNAALEIGLIISNNGWHELKFDKLGEHLFLLDGNGQNIEFSEMSSGLLESISPGESVQGIVRFPAAALTPPITFRFKDVLGKSDTIKF